MDDEATSRRVRGGATKHARGGGATTHISIEWSDEASSWCEGGGAVQQRLELPTFCIREGGAVQQWLELPTSWHEGGGAVRLEGEANLPYQSQACLFATSECLLIMAAIINVGKTPTCLAILQSKIIDM
jgi:hypothetical protein